MASAPCCYCGKSTPNRLRVALEAMMTLDIPACGRCGGIVARRLAEMAQKWVDQVRAEIERIAKEATADA